MKQDRMIKLIDNMIKLTYPKFNLDDCRLVCFTEDSINYHCYLYEHESGMKVSYARCGGVLEKGLLIDYNLFQTLKSYFGYDMIYIVDWFNKEFSQDTKYLMLY